MALILKRKDFDWTTEKFLSRMMITILYKSILDINIHYLQVIDSTQNFDDTFENAIIIPILHHYS